MRSPKFRSVLALTAVVGLVITGMASATDTPSSLCYQVKLQKPPLWVSGAIWIDDKLMMVDPAQNKLLAFSSLGEPRPLPEVQVKGVGEFQPTQLSRVNDSGFLLELADGTLVPLEKNLRVSDRRVPLPEKNALGYRIGSMYQWKVADDSLVGYGALLKGDQIALGFFRMPLGKKTEKPELLMPLADSDFYLIGNSYITTIGETAYYLSMSKHPAIYKVAPGQKPRRLTAFPGEFQTRPDFHTRMTGPKSAAAHFAELETFTVASGLYSHKEMLYVLARKPDTEGRTAWLLYKIDPEKDRVLTPEGIRLPTSTNHLTLAPAEEAWYLIERGRVQDRQQQAIENMIVIESTAIASSVRLPRSCPAK